MPERVKTLQQDPTDGKIYDKADWCFTTAHQNPESEVARLAMAVSQLIDSANSCKLDETDKNRIIKKLCLMQLGIPNDAMKNCVIFFDEDVENKLLNTIRVNGRLGLTIEQEEALAEKRRTDETFKDPVRGATKCLIQGLSFLMDGQQKFGCDVPNIGNPLNLMQLSANDQPNNFDVAYVNRQGDITENAANGKLPCLLCLWKPFDNGRIYTVKKLPVNLIDAKAFKEEEVPANFETSKGEKDTIKEWFNMEFDEHYVISNKNNERMLADGTTGKLAQAQQNALTVNPTPASDGDEVTSLTPSTATGALPQEMFLGDKLSALQTPTDTRVTPSDAVITRNDIAQLMSNLKL